MLTLTNTTMILILSLKSEDFKTLKSSIQKLYIDNIDINLSLVKLQDYSLSGILLTRVALVCDNPEIIKKKGINFFAEAIIPETRYCAACLVLGKFTALNSRNSSGLIPKGKSPGINATNKDVVHLLRKNRILPYA
jgi:hypothetical protein